MAFKTALAFVTLTALSADLSTAADVAESRISTDVKDTRFFLYTRDNDEHEDIARDFDSLADTAWDPSRKTIVLMHGYSSGEHYALPFVDGKIMTDERNKSLQVNYLPF